ncbi:MAG: acyl-CoA dehydrogenase family protein [Acidimicrobiales bacterium]
MMDFTLDETQEAIRQTADGIFGGLVTPDRVREVEASRDRVDRELWGTLAKADLLGLAVPEADGGGGYGLVELAIVLLAQGRVVAPLPLWATLVLGCLPVAGFGSDSLQARTLPGVAAGEVMLTAALADGAARIAADGMADLPVSVRSAGGTSGDVHLSGTAFAVPFAHVAHRVLVPATSPDGGVVIAAVDPNARGASLERAVTTNREIHPHLHLDDVVITREDLLAGGDPARGSDVLGWMLHRALIGLCALQVGVAEAALSQTAAYLATREQFGRPLSTFQGTMLRAADAAIDTESMRVTLWQAAWLLDNGLDADRAVGVAAWFAKEAGQRVVHATQHLHGGIGADIDYPIHRYFLWGKQIEQMLGGPSAQLAGLGRQVVADLRAGKAVSA